MYSCIAYSSVLPVTSDILASKFKVALSKMQMYIIQVHTISYIQYKQ